MTIRKFELRLSKPIALAISYRTFLRNLIIKLSFFYDHEKRTDSLQMFENC